MSKKCRQDLIDNHCGEDDIRDFDAERAMKIFDKERKKNLKHRTEAVTKNERAHTHDLETLNVDNNHTVSVLVDTYNLKNANKSDLPKNFQNDHNDAHFDFDSDRWTSDNIDFEFMTGVHQDIKKSLHGYVNESPASQRERKTNKLISKGDLKADKG